MRKVIDILSEMPKEDLKALASGGVLRRNVIRDVQAVAQYHNTRAEGATAREASDEISSKHGMSARTLYRVLKIYAE